MIRQSVVGVVVAVVAGVLSGCARTDAPPGPAGPTLSLVGARGVSADLRRTVTQLGGAGETTLSAVDTTVWAPFDKKGAAIPDSTAGMPGPVGWLAEDDGGAEDWNRYGSFVDSAGVLHELWLTGKGRGLLSRMAYRRNGTSVVNYRGEWLNVTGGWLLDAEAITYYPEGEPAVRVNVAARQMTVTQAAPGLDALMGAGAAFAGLLQPQPLAAQMYFGACTKEWLGWAGGALLAQLAWGKVLRTKSYKDFRLALAVTAAAGVALDKLVDCMAAQPDQPGP